MINLRNIFSRVSINLKGINLNRKIILIQSDDWGSVRMPSKEIFNLLLSKGIPVNRCPYNRNDSLASEQDLDALFSTLIKYKDRNDNYPVITANTVVANPNFEKIKNSEFREYFYEPFTDTLSRYPKHQNSFQLWKQGMDEKIFYPQFHGREHVNVSLWLKLLQNNNQDFRIAFESQLWGLGPSVTKNGKINIQAAFDTLEKTELLFQKEIIKEGLLLFEGIFGFKSTSFIANNFIWDTSLNAVLSENGVKTIQGMKYQKLPLLDKTKRKMIRHYVGEVNNLGQVHLVRNCTFEPSQYPNDDSVSSCLSDISNAFICKKPAIISAHRLNFIGHVNSKNRNQNLILLNDLLSTILKKWPDVEFMTSNRLGEIILNNKKN